LPSERPAAVLAALPKDLRSLFARVEAIVLDVDGVLTDGSIRRGQDGVESLTFHVRDSSGLWQFRKAGFRSALVTGRGSGIPEASSELLPVDAVRADALDKEAALRSILEAFDLDAARCAYVGDDLLDGPALRLAGLPICVADAEPDVLPLARYVTRRPGGRGAVREVTDLVLEARGLRGPLLARLVGPAGAASR
jgi:3-deoxy-D-manno-octulosonate 8-phosphate phosphatase (KDO 8-P phosphatase)